MWADDAGLFLILSLPLAVSVKSQRVCAVVDNKGFVMVLFSPLWPCIKGKEKGRIADLKPDTQWETEREETDTGEVKIQWVLLKIESQRKKGM